MPSTKFVFFTVLFSLLIPFLSGQSWGADYSAGKAVFKSRCQGCHRIEGDGSHPSAYHKQYRPKDFSKSMAWENMTEEKIKFTLAKGHGVMRPIPLTADEANALIDYMMHDLKK